MLNIQEATFDRAMMVHDSHIMMWGKLCGFMNLWSKRNYYYLRCEEFISTYRLALSTKFTFTHVSIWSMICNFYLWKEKHMHSSLCNVLLHSSVKGFTHNLPWNVWNHKAYLTHIIGILCVTWAKVSRVTCIVVGKHQAHFLFCCTKWKWMGFCNTHLGQHYATQTSNITGLQQLMQQQY
jgi:hypothetical protein